MTEPLRLEFQERMDQKKIEPNSVLGGAVRHLLSSDFARVARPSVLGLATFPDLSFEEIVGSVAIALQLGRTNIKPSRTFAEETLEAFRGNGVNPFAQALP